MERINCFDANGNTITHFTQWDKNQSIYVDNLLNDILPIPHFAFQNSETALEYPDAVSLEDNLIKILIPNSILEHYGILHIFLYYHQADEDKYTTKYIISIPIRKKPKPDFYIYEENVSNSTVTHITAELDYIKTFLDDIASENTSLKTDVSNANLQIAQNTASIQQMDAEKDTTETIMEKIISALKSVHVGTNTQTMVDCTAFCSHESGYEDMLGTYFNLTYTFNNQSKGINTWDNFILEFKDNDKDNSSLLTLRADGFGWWTGDFKTTDEDTFDTADITWSLPDDQLFDGFVTKMITCPMTVNAIRLGNILHVSYKFDDTYEFSCEIKLRENMSNNLACHLTGENVILTNIVLQYI